MGLYMLKFSLFGALYGVLFATIGDTAAQIVAFAAAAGAIGWGWRRIVTPLVELSSMLERLPGWMEHTDDELAEVKQTAERIEAGALVAADRAETAMKIAKDVAGKLGVSSRSDDP